MAFSFKSFVEEAKSAATSAEPTKSIRELMSKALNNPGALVADNPLKEGEDEIMLFEDDSVSIWVCRFVPDTVIPPHEHKMNAFIGVFEGREKNLFFKSGPGGLKYMSTKTIDTGQLLSIGSDGLHSVTAHGEQPCCSLHVYTGPLSKIKRSLFDWDSGVPIDFTDENYESLKKPRHQLEF